MPGEKEITWEVDANGCHNCTSHSLGYNGYPCIKRKLGGKRYWGHRYVYIQHHGEIPEGLVVRHKCDNRACINIEHLELGTIADNNRDTFERGRHRYGVPLDAVGEKNGNAKITEEMVREIRADLTTPNTHLAKKYGITHSNVSLIRLRKTWKHIA